MGTFNPAMALEDTTGEESNSSILTILGSDKATKLNGEETKLWYSSQKHDLVNNDALACLNREHVSRICLPDLFVLDSGLATGSLFARLAGQKWLEP